MIDKLKVFEKAWAEFVEWVGKQDYYEYVKIEHENMVTNYIGKTEINYKIFNPPIKISDRELRSLLIEFLDGKGLYISVGRPYKCWMWAISDEENYRDWESPFEKELSSRPEAEEQGIIKAFEIYNNQLNQRGEK